MFKGDLLPSGGIVELGVWGRPRGRPLRKEKCAVISVIKGWGVRWEVTGDVGSTGGRLDLRSCALGWECS